MVLSTLLQSSMHALVRHAGTELDPFVLVFYRNLFGFLVIIPMLMRTGWSGLHTNHYQLLFLRGFLGIIGMSAWYYSLVYVPITEATALSFTGVVFTALAAIIFLKERVHLRRWLAILGGLVGALVVLQPSTGQFDPLLLLVLFSSAFWALSFPFALYFWQWPVGEQWLWLVLIGVVGVLGNLCLVRA